jgi:hypothetical protein
LMLLQQVEVEFIVSLNRNPTQLLDFVCIEREI